MRAPIGLDAERKAMKGEVAGDEKIHKILSSEARQDRVKVSAVGKLANNGENSVDGLAQKLCLWEASNKVRGDIGPTALGRGNGLQKTSRQRRRGLDTQAPVTATNIMLHGLLHVGKVKLSPNILKPSADSRMTRHDGRMSVMKERGNVRLGDTKAMMAIKELLRGFNGIIR